MRANIQNAFLDPSAPRPQNQKYKSVAELGQLLINAVTGKVESWFRSCPAIRLIGSNMQVLRSVWKGPQLPAGLSPARCVRI